MTQQSIKKWWERNGTWLWRALGAMAMTVLLSLVVDIRDSLKYEQPRIDEIQNEKVHIVLERVEQNECKIKELDDQWNMLQMKIIRVESEIKRYEKD